MSWPPTVWGYAQPGKAKSMRILVEFCAGAGGYMATELQRGTLNDGPAAFCGVVGMELLFSQARRRAGREGGAPFYYIDNAFFDVARERYFRVARNAVQEARVPADLARLDELGIQIKPWRSSGSHILLVEQSDHFLRNVGDYYYGAAAWLESIPYEIRLHTDRPIRIRRWERNKGKASATLHDDLRDCWAVVTHASAAANEALLAGIPVFLTGQSVALELGSAKLAEIETPRMPDGRREWAARLAASQWRLDEMRSGRAWNELNG